MTELTELTKELHSKLSSNDDSLVKDIGRFLDQWKHVKADAKKYSRQRAKDKLKAFVKLGKSPLKATMASAMADHKFKQVMDRQITTNLDELHGIYKSFVFNHIYYHARALEVWSEIYESIGEREEFAKTMKKMEEKEDEEEIQERTKDFEAFQEEEETPT
eukprot:CAMPEP_0117427408 /NCGR_PEP_ID=MMETSP0758-20121206/7261_1 /TAXON_ID=63605 /ORGANISM="Percolomonas cosmopolitus, Strain AE-1 (ATCC 50343)" /LENGTH=160 /DNA_ID=CAMNT_0005213025 /DNA_START=196 /DNA_END=674 /DNA_ORIENTATION=-